MFFSHCEDSWVQVNVSWYFGTCRTYYTNILALTLSLLMSLIKDGKLADCYNIGNRCKNCINLLLIGHVEANCPIQKIWQFNYIYFSGVPFVLFIMLLTTTPRQKGLFGVPNRFISV